MKGKKVHQRKVASTHQKKLAHIQRKTNAPAPMKMGNIFVFLTGGPSIRGRECTREQVVEWMIALAAGIRVQICVRWQRLHRDPY